MIGCIIAINVNKQRLKPGYTLVKQFKHPVLLESR